MVLFLQNNTGRRTTIYFLILVFVLQTAIPVKAYNLRRINNMENLSGSTVFSFYQDNKGMIWMGTSRGLDRYDGKYITNYTPESNKNFFTGSQINKIEYTDDNLLWIQTYHGLHKLNLNTSSLESFDMFNRIAFSDKDSQGNIFLIQGNNSIYYLLKGESKFEQIFIPDLKAKDIVDFFIDETDHLWIFFKDGNCLHYSIQINEAGICRLDSKDGYTHSKEILYCSSDGIHLIYFIDGDDKLYEYNTALQDTVFIYNLHEYVTGEDDITSLVKLYDDYFIGFKTDGLSLLRKTEQSYVFEKIDVPGGISCLYKDKYQDIVWIGVTGQGVYTYSIDKYSIHSFRLSDLTYKIRQPISAIFVDKENTLWLGSKGDGILRVYDFETEKNIASHRMEIITTSTSSLKDNIILSFAQSREGNLWIGCERGLNYFSFVDDKYFPMRLSYNEKEIEHISAILEQDSVLWISTLGMGIIKVKLTWNNKLPVLTPENHFIVKETDEFTNYFTNIYPENDSILWCMNKGEGIFRLNTVNWEYEHICFEGNIINETNVIRKDHRGNYLIGTNFGLVKYKFGEYKLLNEVNGFPTNSVYSILFDGYSQYWLSTNRGLISYNSNTESFRAYDHLDGLTVLEFNEGSSFKDENKSILFFGGTNGLVTIQANFFDEDKHYMAPLYFRNLTIKDKEYPVEEFLSQKGDAVFIKLSHEQNFFTLSFSAIDHLNGNGYSYYYKLDGNKTEWIYNGNSNSISFVNLQPGNYRLFVKYYNKVLEKESYIYKIDIKVLPPWYKSSFAYGIYILLIIAIISLLSRILIVYNRKKKADRLQKLEQTQREQIYESKLRFFTNIAHEFCTPLTLIYGPCNRLLENKNLSGSVIKYTSIIKHNAERLNSLIQDLIEFNRIESGYKKPKITLVDVSTLSNQLVESFVEIAESRKIKLEKDIAPFVKWNSDKNFIVTILTNLLSNAFKYTTNEKKIKIRIRIMEDGLYIVVSNTGEGIAEKDVPTLFDRYHILQSFERNDNSSLWSRNGLGLAIAYNMVQLLKGSIEVESIPDEWTHFKIKLPYLEITESDSSEDDRILLQNIPPEHTPSFNIPVNSLDESKPTLLVVDDEAEIRWLIFDLFQEDYNVLTVTHPVEAIEILKDIHPDLIISDVIMQEMDGFTFSRQIKADETTAHIPFILLSARRDVEGQIAGLNAGAEVYITKPFNMDYLKSSVRRLLERKESLKEYFSSPLSSYTLENGKFYHKEHKKFMNDIIKIINKNISNKDLSAHLIAEKMNMGVRTLYRKLEEIEYTSLTELINNSRLTKATRLLTKTKLTIDEIVFQSGFTNRSSFYRAFSKKYNCTPTAYRQQQNTAN